MKKVTLSYSQSTLAMVGDGWYGLFYTCKPAHGLDEWMYVEMEVLVPEGATIVQIGMMLNGASWNRFCLRR